MWIAGLGNGWRKRFTLLSFKSLEAIAALKTEVEGGRNPRDAKVMLAKDQVAEDKWMHDIKWYVKGVQGAVLANAPAAEHGFFGVPKVIE